MIISKSLSHVCIHNSEQLRSLLLSVADPPIMRFIWPEYLMGSEGDDEEDPRAGNEK